MTFFPPMTTTACRIVGILTLVSMALQLTLLPVDRIQRIDTAIDRYHDNCVNVTRVNGAMIDTLDKIFSQQQSVVLVGTVNPVTNETSHELASFDRAVLLVLTNTLNDSKMVIASASLTWSERFVKRQRECAQLKARLDHLINSTQLTDLGFAVHDVCHWVVLQTRRMWLLFVLFIMFSPVAWWASGPHEQIGLQ